jgi:hypothetical protein
METTKGESTWQCAHRQYASSRRASSLPGETRSYVAAVTGLTADEWSSASPPKDAEASIPRAIPCTRLANLILPAKQGEAQHIEAHIPRWGIWVAAHLTESKAWAMYRDREKQLAHLIGRRPPVVLHRQLPGVGMAKRYIIAIGDHNRAPLDSLCAKITAVDFSAT